jgi:G3E family GTPase
LKTPDETTPAAAVAAPMPVTVIAGYLGAGKTTLVNRLLRHADGLRMAVLVNEFGELPIDADLIESTDGNVVAIAGGCICCSYGSDLMAAMMELTRLSPRPEHVLIETSGVALPGPVAASLSLLTDYVHDGTVVLADAETVLRQGRDRYLADTIQRQLADADFVILNKADLVDAETLVTTDSWVRSVAPRASIVATRNAAVQLEVIVGGRLVPQRGGGLSLGGSSATAFASDAFDVAAPCDPAALAAALSDPALGILRAKGFVRDLDGRRVSIQIVGSRREVAPASPGGADRDGLAGLVAIGLKGRIDLPAIAAIVAAAQSPAMPPPPSAA